MSCFRERVVVVLGAYIDSGRSGTEAVKRIIRYISCSGRAVTSAMLQVWEAWNPAATLGGVRN